MTAPLVGVGGDDAAFAFADRATGAPWAWYANVGTARLATGSFDQLTLSETGDMTIAGTLTAQDAAFYHPGGNDPVTVTGDSFARIRFMRGPNTWTAGAIPGQFEIADQNSGISGLTVDTGTQAMVNVRRLRIAAEMEAGGYIYTPNDISCLGVLTGSSVMPLANNASSIGSASVAWRTVHAYDFATASDPRLKSDIMDAPDGCLGVVTALQPKTFQYGARLPQEARRWGFLAPDVKAAMAEAGLDFGGHSTDSATGLESLSYDQLIPVLWRAVQELAERVAILTARETAAREP